MLRDASYHLIGHIGVDLARQFYEASREIVFAGLPGEVERVDGDAVAAETGSRIESLEPERFGLRSVDDLPDIEAHALTEELQFVHQGDIDTAVDVLPGSSPFRPPHRRRPEQSGRRRHRRTT